MSGISLEKLVAIGGFEAAALVDSESGLALAIQGSTFDLELSAAGTAEMLNAKRRTIKLLGVSERIEDILISLDKHYHLIRPLERNDNLFLYLVLNRTQANLALARHELKHFEHDLDFS